MLEEEREENNGVNIYMKVYNMLLKQDLDRIRPYELYFLIENMKIDSNEIIETIKEVLLEAGLNEGNIERISNNIAYRLRFTRSDAREIEKELCNRGWIERQRNYIIINGNK